MAKIRQLGRELKGAEYKYLGHFAKPEYACQGHNDGPGLEELQNKPDMGYVERQTADHESLTSQIMKKYKLGPTGRKDAEAYANDLRTFSNANGFEGPKDK